MSVAQELQINVKHHLYFEYRMALEVITNAQVNCAELIELREFAGLLTVT